MIELRACPGCQRHVDIATTACPFCATALDPGSPRPRVPLARASRIAVFTSTTLASTACWTSTQPPPPPPQQTTMAPPDLEPDPQPAERAWAQAPDDAQVTAPPPPPRPPPPPAIDAGVAHAVGTASVSGVVTGSRTKRPIAGLAIRLLLPDRRELQQVVTDAQGRYQFVRLAAGDYSIEFGNRLHPRQNPAEARVKLVDGEAKRVDRTIFQADPSHGPMPYGAPPARRRIA